MSKAGQINHMIGQGKHPTNNRFGYTFDIKTLLELKKMGVKLKFKRNSIKWTIKKEGDKL